MDVHQASGPFPVGVGNRDKSFPHAAYSVLVLKEGQNFERGPTQIGEPVVPLAICFEGVDFGLP